MKTSPQFEPLNRLATLICDIDVAKTHMPEIIPAIIATAGSVIDQMKMDLMDIGALETLIPPIASISKNREHLVPLMIEAAHIEVERLMGDESHLCYMPEDAAA